MLSCLDTLQQECFVSNKKKKFPRNAKDCLLGHVISQQGVFMEPQKIEIYGNDLFQRPIGLWKGF